MKTFVPTQSTMMHGVPFDARGVPFGIPGVAPDGLLRRIARKVSERLVTAVLALVGYEEREEVEKTPGRIVLPMSSGVSILPNTSAQITTRPQACAFRPERLIIGGNPENWIVNDIRVGNRTQFAQAGDVPGEVFAYNATDAQITFETVQTAMDFVVIVTYIGDKVHGEPFAACAIGPAAF